MVLERVPGADRVTFSAHTHNDLDLAVANALAAVQAGARQVECTINGIGARAGNASMEEIVMAMRTRPDKFPYHNRIVPQHIMKASRRSEERRGGKECVSTIRTREPPS